MKVISVSGDECALRVKSALINLFQALATHRLCGTRVYRLALARRFSLCYVAFLQYLTDRLHVHEGTDEDTGLESLLHYCRQHMIFTHSDERMVIKMSMLYAALTYYKEGFDSSSDDLIRDIPQMATFLELFIETHDTLVMQRSIQQIRKTV